MLKSHLNYMQIFQLSEDNTVYQALVINHLTQFMEMFPNHEHEDLKS